MRKNQPEARRISSSKQRTNFPTVPVTEVPPPGTRNYRPVVLVVDDEGSIADSLSDILCRSGYAAMVAYDGLTALETALLMPPELLITDVVLPGMGGIELAITVKRVFPDCKIILFSGHASTTDLLATAGRAGHAFVMLNKPVHPRDLLARVAEALKPSKTTAAADGAGYAESGAVEGAAVAGLRSN
jgi:DNA-binding response OmpR family regulator